VREGGEARLQPAQLPGAVEPALHAGAVRAGPGALRVVLPLS
jgi:hypothetical protein